MHHLPLTKSDAKKKHQKLCVILIIHRPLQYQQYSPLEVKAAMMRHPVITYSALDTFSFVQLIQVHGTI